MLIEIFDVEKFLDELSDASPDPSVGIYLKEGVAVLKKYEVRRESAREAPSDVKEIAGLIAAQAEAYFLSNDVAGKLPETIEPYLRRLLRSASPEAPAAKEKA